MNGESTTPGVAVAGRDAELGCDEAAALLDVPAAALEVWSQKLSFPCDVGGPTGPRFRRREIEALREALPNAHSVSGAIHVARLRAV